MLDVWAKTPPSQAIPRRKPRAPLRATMKLRSVIVFGETVVLAARKFAMGLDRRLLKYLETIPSQVLEGGLLEVTHQRLRKRQVSFCVHVKP